MVSVILRDGLSDWVLLCLFSSLWSLSDVSVEFLIEGFEGGNLVLGKSKFPLAELFLVSVFIFFLEQVHVCLDVLTEDVVSVFLGIEDTCGWA